MLVIINIRDRADWSGVDRRGQWGNGKDWKGVYWNKK